MWDKDIEETANLDQKTLPFISEDTCYRLDDIPCEEIVYNPDYPGVDDTVEASVRFNTKQKATYEREGEIATLTFEVELLGNLPQGKSVTFDWFTEPGTATPADDYGGKWICRANRRK